MIEVTVRHHCRDLIRLFDDLFRLPYRVRLCGGAREPWYQPAVGGNPACIHFRADYFASALHEVAHWCIAGPARRRLPDYGYWYLPDGRDEASQRVFEQVEVAPQALEWLFADAARFPFRPSLDNLEGDPGQDRRFRLALEQERRRRLQTGLPVRAAAFRAALSAFYGHDDQVPVAAARAS